MSNPSFSAFTTELRDVEAQTAALEKRYEELFTEVGVHLFNHALDHDTVTDTMSHLYAYTEHALSDFLNSRFNQQQLDCKISCASCCHLTVECPPQVILYVADYLREKWTEAQIEDLLVQLDTYVSDKTSRPDVRNPPCPFLNAENTCKIYEARPISCRAFTSPNVKLCHKFIDERTGELNGIPQHALIYRVYEMATTALQAAAQKHERDKEQLHFIPTLAAALRNPDMEADWKAGKTILQS